MCFSLAWFEQILIWLVVICAVVGILKLLIPFVMSKLGADLGIIPAILNIVMWAVIIIAVIIFAFDMIGCLLGGASFHFLR